MTEKRIIKAHPLAILVFLKPFVFILLIPFLKAFLQYLTDQKITNVILNEFLALGILLICATVRWYRFRIEITPDQISIFTGLFIRRNAVIDLKKISTIEVVRNPFDYVFGSASVRINTEAGVLKKADYEMRIGIRQARYIMERVSSAEKHINLKFSVFRVALMAAATSSSITGMVLLVPVIYKSGSLLGTAVEDVIFRRIEQVSDMFSIYVARTVTIVTIIFLICYFMAFLYSLSKYFNFKLSASREDMEVVSGFVTRRHIRFKVDAINDICVEQSVLMRLLKRCMLRIDIGGYGTGRGEKAVVVPSVRKNDVKEQFKHLFPNINKNKEYIRPHKGSRWRFFLTPAIWIVVTLALAAVLSVLFPTFKDLTWFLEFVMLAVLLYFCSLANFNFKHGKMSVDEVLYIKYSLWDKTRETYCGTDRIGVISVIKFPLDSVFGSCNVRFTVCSEGAESMLIRHIPYDQLIAQIDRKYNIFE